MKIYLCFVSLGNTIEDTLMCEDVTKTYKNKDDAEEYCYRINTMRRAEHARFQEYELE